MAGLAAAHVGDLDLHQFEAHGLGVEAVRRLDVLHGQCDVADPHGATVVGGAVGTEGAGRQSTPKPRRARA